MEFEGLGGWKSVCFVLLRLSRGGYGWVYPYLEDFLVQVGGLSSFGYRNVMNRVLSARSSDVMAFSRAVSCFYSPTNVLTLAIFGNR